MPALLSGELAIGGNRVYALISKWRERCDALAGDRRYWEAAQLQQAINDLHALLDERAKDEASNLRTDADIKRAYESASQSPPQSPLWTIRWPVTVTD